MHPGLNLERGKRKGTRIASRFASERKHHRTLFRGPRAQNPPKTLNRDWNPERSGQLPASSRWMPPPRSAAVVRFLPTILWLATVGFAVGALIPLI